jgi:hypothetical protein
MHIISLKSTKFWNSLSHCHQNDILSVFSGDKICCKCSVLHVCLLLIYFYYLKVTYLFVSYTVTSSQVSEIQFMFVVLLDGQLHKDTVVPRFTM